MNAKFERQRTRLSNKLGLELTDDEVRFLLLKHKQKWDAFCMNTSQEFMPLPRLVVEHNSRLQGESRVGLRAPVKREGI